MSPGRDGHEPALSVDLFVEAPDPEPRRDEPVSCGLPWPRGVLFDPTNLRLLDENHRPCTLQTRILDRWSDGSVRWLLVDWLAAATGRARYRLCTGVAAAPPPLPVSLRSNDARVTVTTPSAEFEIARGSAFPFAAVRPSKGQPAFADFVVRDQADREYRARVDLIEVEETGPVRASVRLAGMLTGDRGFVLGSFEAYLHFFAPQATVRISLTLRNPQKADHTGGLWDLGAAGSIYIRDAALTLRLPPDSSERQLWCSCESQEQATLSVPPLTLYQDSSGGENWHGRNHLNRQRVVPISFRGYKVRSDGGERLGLRATPCLSLRGHDACISIAMRQCWQSFPKALEATADALVLRLFPHQYGDVHELQGGEQKTHHFSVALARDPTTDIPLHWCRAPLRVRAAPEWYAASGAIPYLTPKSHDPNTAYLNLVDAAIEGTDTFFQKREVIDEYGWRHFGEVYGDHEAVFHTGPTPLVSHYNNQYDPIAGFGSQFLRSGDFRWWELMDDLAGHVVDIDIYHTDADKAAYNHGLFWHTCHYVDADTSTHRSYPRAGGVCGGGPGCEHNYTTGLMLHYFLTGSARSRRAAIELAQWVLDMDDGRKTPFRWLDRGDTGLASATVSPNYHGPGRGGGNSINALLDGYRLTGNPAFRAKLEQLLHRCIHPADDIDARNLLDAEHRWSYTVFLQALGRYLDDKTQRGELDEHYAYARASLLHYARWMAEHEIPYLDWPERLKMPTETWAAQDMRKSDVFKYAAKHATGAERERFLERARFYFQYSVTTLEGMKTRTLARPVIILLSYGFMQAYFDRHADETAPAPRVSVDFGRPAVFMPQKVRALRRAVLLAGAGLVVVATALAWLVVAR